MLRILLNSAFCSLFLAASGAAAELSTGPSRSAPKVAPASNEGELAMKRFVLQPGFKVDLFAAEPHLANPVAFHIDNDNRFWVAETFRLHAGVPDIRGKMSWLDEDLASRTTGERLAIIKRHEGDKLASYEENSERVKLVQDKNRDGKADASSVFAEGFNSAVDGLAASVLSRDGNVYFANIPNLWLLKDNDGDGVADERRSLHYGYGVRTGFIGHDLHGLIMGPDGRLYFSIGDRGSNIEIDGKRVGQPDSGCVFRCNPDGTDLEVFAYGLRNPQELAFDQFGNLFTGDNNSDGGDRARLVYLVKGGDSGWRIGFQFLERPNARGPWNSERMWHPRWEGQAAYIIPPIANHTDGPSGFAYYPGTGLPQKYRQKFFLVDFHGGKGSGIYTFELQPRGSFFELAEVEKFLWEALPTDVAFGPEPGVYFTDWVQGWGMTGKGRIYRVTDAEAASSQLARETTTLLTEGFGQRSTSELGKLFAHADMRVRMEAQFELAKRGEADALARAAKGASTLLARLHGIWGLGQLARQTSPNDSFAKALRPLLTDKDAEVRAQAAKVIGDSRIHSLRKDVAAALDDENERVRVHAAIAAADLNDQAAAPALVALLKRADNKDPIQRHAAAYALAELGDMEALLAASANASPAVRMGALLALRRLERAEIARFLHDSDPLIVVEAARAINDVPISGAIPELAGLARNVSAASDRPELLRRIINANFRFGTRASAATLASLAGSETLPANLRAEAVNDLANWKHPSGRDQITGLWRPLAGARDDRDAVRALEPALAPLLSKAPDAVRIAAARAAVRLDMPNSGEPLLSLLRSDASASTRIEALRALAALKDSRLELAVQAAAADPSEELRSEALKHHAHLKPSGALAQLQNALESGSTAEKQSALATLANMQDPSADELLALWTDKLLAGNVPPELQLDVLDAAGQRNTAALKPKLAAFGESLDKGGDLAPYRVALIGGNPSEGKKIFFERAEAACARCHRIQGENSEGGQVGPELTGIGSRQSREYLLESIVFPNQKISEGFESLLVTTKDGSAFAGVLKGENAAEIVLNSPEDGEVTIKRENVASRERGLSSMPESLTALLSKRDLRDLIEYLSSLK